MMRPDVAVIPQDILGDCQLGLGEIPIASFRYPFRFQTPEKSLHWAVVPAISAATQTLGYLVTPQQLPEGATGIVTALVTVEQQAFRPASLLKCHVQRLLGQLAVR